MSETYLRVCVLVDGHDGDHLPYGLAPKKDEYGNVYIEHPRCVHVTPAAEYETQSAPERYRVVFETIDPRMPRAGWHEVVKEHRSLDDALEHVGGLELVASRGDNVRNARVERATVVWNAVPIGGQA